MLHAMNSRECEDALQASNHFLHTIQMLRSELCSEFATGIFQYSSSYLNYTITLSHVCSVLNIGFSTLFYYVFNDQLLIYEVNIYAHR